MLSERKTAELAAIDQAQLQRWQKKGLLERRSKNGYEREDVAATAALAALWAALDRELAATAWRQVRHDLDFGADRAEVVVRPRTDEAHVVASAAELDQALVRDEPALVVDITARVREAVSAFEAYRVAHGSA